MKSIKSTFVRTLSLLLALIMVFSIPISAFATTETDPDVSLLSYNYDTIPDDMLNNSLLRALDYLGYDVDFLKSEEVLYKYITSGLVEQYPSKFPCPVPYCSNGVGTGLQTTTVRPSGINVTSSTGKYPDLSTFKRTGLDCVDFAAYYLTNYLPNIEGVNIDWLDDIMDNYSGRGFTYDNMYFWPEAMDDLIDAGVKVWKINAVDFTDGEISKYTDPQGNVCTDDIYPKLKIGTLIQMGSESNEAVHYGLYAGTYDGKHYMVHSGSSDRGPEISIVEYMALYNTGDKQSSPLYFYDFSPLTEEQYGSVTVEKEGPNGEMLAGAKFKLTNVDTGDFYFLVTDSYGKADQDKLPLGNYTIQETVAPAGYVLDSKVYSFELTSSYSHHVHSATNARAKGSIIAVKYKDDGTTWLPGAVFGCKTSGKDEYVYVYDADSGSVTFTDPTNNRTVTAYADGKANGVVTFANLPLGTYRIYEAKAPGGYIRTTLVDTVVLGTNGQVERAYKPLDGNYTNEYLDANGEPYNLFTNTLAVGSVIVGKYNNTLTGMVRGAVFGCKTAGKDECIYIYDADSGSVTFTDPTNGRTITAYADGKANGVVTFANLPLGNYVIYEAKAPDGYVWTSLVVPVKLATHGQIERILNPLDGNYTDDYLDASGEPYSLFINKKAFGSIQVVKYRENSDVWVPGAVFGILTDSGERLYVYDATSGSVTFTDPYSKESVTVTADGGGNGAATFSNLPMGTYRVYEAMPPAGYIRSTLIETVVLSTDGQRERLYKPADGNYTEDYLDENGEPYDLFYNTAAGSVRVHKYNEDATGYVFGSVFALRNTVTGNIVYRYDADSGEVTFVDPVTGKTVTVSADGGGNGSMTWTNRTLGTYELYEAKAPEGYVRDETIVTVELTAPGQFERVYKPTNGYTEDYLDASGLPYHLFCNALDTGGIIVYKRDDSTMLLVPGAVFGCYGSDGGVYYRYDAEADASITFIDPRSGEEITCYGDGIADGCVTFDDLPYGTYEILELVAPEDYDLGESDGITVTLSIDYPSHVSEYDFLNKAHRGSAEIVKETTNGGTKAGWLFEFYLIDGSTATLLGTYPTNAEGKILLDELMPGRYLAREIGHESMTEEELRYWTMETYPQYVEVSANETASVTFTNEWLGKLAGQKISLHSDVLEGWIIQIELPDGTVIDTVTTDAEGKFALDIAPGEYVLREIGHETIVDLSDWVLDSAKTVTVTAGVTTEVSFTNTLLSRLSVFKESTNSGLIAGWIVEITKLNDDGTETIVGTEITNTNGEFSLLIAPGRYRLEEIGHSDSSVDLTYWVMDDPQEIEINAGEAATVTFSNILLGKGQISNEVVLSWKRTSTNYYDTLIDDCHLYTYGLDLTKVFSDGNGNFANVNFKIRNTTDGYWVKAEQDPDTGIYYVTGHASSKATGTTFVPTDAGKIIVKGLENDTYILTETKTDNGYSLDERGIEVIISTASTESSCNIYAGDVLGVVQDLDHKLLTASATVDGNPVNMLADNGSVNALAALEIENDRDWGLPETGDLGAYMLAVAGTVGIAACVCLFFVVAKSKKKNAQ